MTRTDRRDERQRLGVLALAVAGTLVGHTIGYELTGVDDGVHAYIGPLARVVVPLALAALVWAAVGIARRTDLDGRGLVQHLTALQIGLFLLQEGAELAATAGPDRAAHLLPILVGLAAQPLVAAGLGALVRLTGRALTALVDPRPAPLFGRGLALRPAHHRRVPFPVVAQRAHRPRGPPSFVAHD